MKSIELNIRCRCAFNSSCKCYWTINNIIKFRISYSKYYITNCSNIINIRLKYLEMIINVISKISYKKNTLTWYRSFKQNFFNNLIINNLNHKRIMKKVYNKFIEWTFGIIAILLYILLVTVKLTMKVVVKIARAIIFVVEEIFTVIGRITEGLEERLSIKD